MREFFTRTDIILIGHNIVRFDIPVLERLLNIKITCKAIDTLAVSWYLYPKRDRHNLEGYGEEFGVPKPKVTDWSEQPLEVYVNRCQEDVRITKRLWEMQYNNLLEIYGSESEALRFLEYLSFKMYCARLQEESGWRLDTDHLQKSLVVLLQEQKEKTEKLSLVMPRVPVKVRKQLPKKAYNKQGKLSKIGQSWFDLLEKENLPPDTQETEIITEYTEPNPNSTDQKKEWLYYLGWVPTTFKTVKNKTTGEKREVPQITKEAQKGGGLCESVKLLYEKEPNLELLDGLSIIQHRISILNGFLRDVKNGRLQAKISGLTNTLRFQHEEIVNLPRSDRPYAEGIRGSLIADEGYELIGADMSSLEDRLKQHFIFPYDPDYVIEMSTEGYDPHLSLALFAKKITIEQSDNYKSGVDKKIKPLRDIYKNGNYSLQYNAYPPTVARTCGISLKEAKELFDLYWKKNWSLKKVAETLRTKTVGDLVWQQNPINKFWYNLRKMNDQFSTLVQGTASYVFDLWLMNILKHRPQLTATFHDEGVWQIKKGYREQCNELLINAINETNKELKLNRELGISIQYGQRYSDIH